MPERLGEIQSWFVVRATPEGTAPDSIREQWKDMPLPVRYQRIEAE